MQVHVPKSERAESDSFTYSGRESRGQVCPGAAHHIQAGSTSTVGPKDEDLPRIKTGRKRKWNLGWVPLKNSKLACQ